ncbi:MAG: hypothetical protein IPM60_10380 [Rhodospirillales bacterium]|nr:hypothetical protein [Rhodospirillales bacterium]
MAGRRVGLEAHRVVGADLQRMVGDLERLIGRGAARHDTDQRRRSLGASVRGGTGGVCGDKDGAGGAGLDALLLQVQELAEPGGAAGDGQVRLRVGKHHRRRAALPLADFGLKAVAQSGRIERAAVEQDGVDPRAVPQEVRQMLCHGAVGGVRQAQFLERRAGADRPLIRVAGWKEAVEQDRVDLVPRHVCGERAGNQTGAARRDGEWKTVLRRAVGGEDVLLEVAAPGHEVVPLAAGEAGAAAGEPWLQEVGKRQVDVVAAEQDMVADGDPADGGDGAA